MGDMQSRKTVVITGCSEGGLGAALATAFANNGFYVFATLRDPVKAGSMPSSNIEVLPLEVTSQESIEACASRVAQRLQGRGLDALVNNAGLVLIQPLLDTTIEQGKELFDVNVWGLLAVTKAFAPLVIKAKGTVLNISSIAGAVRMAWQGVYNSSKASVLFLSETLRMEMNPLGVKVICAMVGEVETNIYAHSKEISKLPEDSHYKAVEEKILRQRRGELQVNNEKAAVTAENLVRDVMSQRNGQVWRGGVAGTAKFASWLLPTRLFEWILHQNRGIYDLKST